MHILHKFHTDNMKQAIEYEYQLMKTGPTRQSFLVNSGNAHLFSSIAHQVQAFMPTTGVSKIVGKMVPRPDSFLTLMKWLFALWPATVF